MFGTGFLSNGCFLSTAIKINVSDAKGPLFSQTKGHLCLVTNPNNCSAQGLPSLCGTEGATVLDCNIISFASDCSQISLACTDQSSGLQSFHTLGMGRARPLNPNSSGFVDGVPLTIGSINIFHGDSTNPSADCGRIIGSNPLSD
jgi:hypothetical protein